MNPEDFDDAALFREVLRRTSAKDRVAELRKTALSALSPKQRAFVEDVSRRRVAITSRQSGKTTGCLTYLVDAAQEPNTEHLYIAPTRQAARDVFWERLKIFCEEHHVVGKPNETTLEMRFDNGSKIALKGVPDLKAANRLRGPTRKSVVIDEAAVYPDALLKTLVVDVIEQSLLVKKGNLILVSTPGLQPKGFFYDLAHSKGVKLHTWGMHDNPAFDNVDEILEQKLIDNAWTRQTPTFRREYLGEWCADTEAAVYRVNETNLYSELPEGDWSYVLGVDFGYRDEAAFIVIGWREHDPVLYVVHEESDQELLVDDYVSRIRALMKRYAPVAIVADAGALGKTLVETLVTNHGLPIEAADKRDKPVAIRQVNADLAKVAIKLERDGLFEQMSTLRWHPDKIGLVEQPGMPNDRCDAFLYAYRRAHHYIQKPLPPKLTVGSAEYFAQIEAEIRQQHELEASADPWSADPWGD